MITLAIVLSILGGSAALAGAAFLLSRLFNDFGDLLDRLATAFGALAAVALISTFFLSIAAITVNCGEAGRHAKYQVKREVLAYRLENRDQHIVEDLELYDDILEFNSHVVYAREYADDPWIGLYVDKAWLGIDEIEL